MISVRPSKITGQIAAIPSKSDAHRAIICAALAQVPTKIDLVGTSLDIEATIFCVESIGAEVERGDGFIVVRPIKDVPLSPALDMGESGSTLRFLLPVAAAIAEGATFKGSGRLPERPIGDLLDALKGGGARFSSDKLPLRIEKCLENAMFKIRGDISSQYVSGLLFALPLVGGGEIALTTSLESAPYVGMTVNTMAAFGVDVERENDTFKVTAEQKYKSPSSYAVEGDWSNAAFFLISGAINEKITLSGLNRDSLQGDKEILDILRAFGAIVHEENEQVIISPGELSGINIDLTDIPDTLPALSIVAALSKGQTVFTGAKRLRLKESDRISSVVNLVRALGAQAKETDDGLVIEGGLNKIKSARVDSCGDHRIAMAAAIAGTVCDGKVEITNERAVDKSYPAFFEHLKMLGGKIDVE